MLALGLGVASSSFSFVALHLLAINLSLIPLFATPFPGAASRQTTPREYATWIMIGGLAVFVGWATARSVFLYGRRLVR